MRAPFHVSQSNDGYSINYNNYSHSPGFIGCGREVSDEARLTATQGTSASQIKDSTACSLGGRWCKQASPPIDHRHPDLFAIEPMNRLEVSTFLHSHQSSHLWKDRGAGGIESGTLQTKVLGTSRNQPPGQNLSGFAHRTRGPSRGGESCQRESSKRLERTQLKRAMCCPG